MPAKKNPHAVALGKLGGAVSTPAKRDAVKANGLLGGRPREKRESRPKPEDRREGPGRPPLDNPRTEQVLIRATVDEKARWKASADDAGLRLPDWARGRLNEE